MRARLPWSSSIRGVRMPRFGRFALAFAFLATPALISAGTMSAQESMAEEADTSAQRYLGAPVSIGQGMARTVVRTDESGDPEALGVEFTSGALEGLPKESAEGSSLNWHSFLAFPPDAPDTGFNHLMINWNPEGHHPEKIYGVPHFDFHFYVIDWDRQLAIRYPHPETPDTTGVTRPADDVLPDGYMIPPGTHVNQMGLHAVPKSAPEFQGKPFVHTFIYGYTDGELAFLEPMITHKFLESRSDHATAVPTPERYGTSGWYPTEFRVEYDEEDDVYRVMFDELERSGE